MKISDEVSELLMRQWFAVVCTLDAKMNIHCSAKDVGYVDQAGKIYLIDLYQGRTHKNLKANPTVSITSIDEKAFVGYTIKGRADVVMCDKIDRGILDTWEKRLTHRMSQRVIDNIHKESGSPKHPESRFPKPKCIIEVEVEEIVDLAPAYLKRLI